MRHPLSALVLVFIVLATGYNVASPLFENSDEFFHFPFIKHLADNNLSLPVQSGDDLQDWRQQGSQPPLYHMLSAILIMPIDTSDYGEVRRVNPHAQIGIVGETNINAVIHPLDRSQEFSGGTALAVRVVRFFSTLLAAVVLVATYFLVVYTFPQVPRWVALLAAGLVAFNPMYLFVASSINNDNLSNAVVSVILALFAWRFRQSERPPVWVMLTIGVLLGVGLLSKLSMGPFMLLVGLYWLLMAMRYQAWAYMVGWGFVTLGIALFISSWWYFRNYQLYDDPTGLNVFLDIVGRRAIPLTAEQLWSERDSFIFSFWGLFGGLTVKMADWVYSLFNILAAISIVGTVLYVVRRRRLDFPQVVLFLWPIMVLISLVRWTALTWATQGRLWFVAIAALAALSAIGFYELSRRSSRLVPGLVLGYTGAMAIIAPVVWLAPAYAAPDFYQSDAQPIATFHDPDVADEQIALMRVEFPNQVETGTDAPIWLEWCAQTPLSRDWSVFVHLTNTFDIILAQADFTPGSGAVPTSEVEAGACWQDEYPIPIEAGIASEDTELNVVVGLYHAASGARMRMADESRLWVQNTDLRVGDELLKFSFEDRVRLLDYELSAQVTTPEQKISITLEWDVLERFEENYTVFVQVIDLATANRVAASDKQPEGGTTAWEQGQSVTDTHIMTVNEDAPPGVYAVIVGFYVQNEAGGFQRLRMVYDGIDTGFDFLNLTQIRIE